MLLVRYTAWDGTQRVQLTAGAVFDKLADYLAHTDEVRQALDWLMRQGFQHDGMEVMGLDALLQRVREAMQALLRDVDVRPAVQEMRDRLDGILDTEREALDALDDPVRAAEQRAWLNDLPAGVSDAMQRLRDYRFESAAARAAFEDLLDDLDDLRDLESFQRQHGARVQQGQPLGFDEAVALMREIERLRALADALASGDVDLIDPDRLRELLGGEAGDAIGILRELQQMLARGGYLADRDGRMAVTPRGVRRMGQLALRDIYQGLLRDRPGVHRTDHRGIAVSRPDECKPWTWGEPLDLDLAASVGRAVARGGGVPIALAPDDFIVHGTEHQTTTATVLLLDMSWSMSWEGRFAAAKKVALAMESLIRSRYPRDFFAVVGFFTRAVELKARDLPQASWNMGDPFTNLQDGLRLAARLLTRHPSTNRQMIVITDGQPTAYFVKGRLFCEWPLSFGGVSMRAASETLKEVERVTRQGVVINTFMLDDNPSLRAFVEKMTRINRGRALYTRPDRLGRYLLVDYLRRKTKRV